MANIRETQMGKQHISGLHDQAIPPVFGTMTLYARSGGASLGSAYVSPNFSTLRVGPGADIVDIKDQSGGMKSASISNEYVEMQFDFLPEGSSKANAKLSATLPEIYSGATTANFPVIPIGPFDDGLNSTTTTNPWFVVSAPSLNGSSERNWTGSITLRRYQNIVNLTDFLEVTT